MNRITCFTLVLLCLGTAAHAQTSTASVRIVPVQPPVPLASDRAHVLVGSNELVSSDFLAAFDRRSNLTVVADFWYNAAARRVLARTMTLGEVDDPADLKMFRAPGSYPNAIRGTVAPWSTSGNVGFAGFTVEDGVRAYFAAVQGYVLTPDTGVLALSTAMGRAGVGRNGQRYGEQDLVPHVAIFPSGMTVFGWDTPPGMRPAYTVQILGDLRVEGVVYASKCVEVP